MPNAFNFAVSPFDCLTPDEQALVCSGVDIAYFPEGAVVLDRGMAPTHLFVIIKGHVEQTEGEQLLASYGPEDCFDGRALVAGRASSRFVVVEELVAYQLAHETVNELIARNTAFGALLFADLGHKLGTLAQRADQHERQSLTLMRVEQAFVRPAHVVDAATDIVSVTRLFQEQRTTSVLVSGLPQGIGIFSNTTLQRAILDGRPLAQLAVGEFASSPVISVRASDQLGDAMALLLRARVHRLAVLDGDGQVCGMLEALDLFSFLANHSHLILVQIEQAGDLQALEHPAAQITQLLSALHRGGTRIALMAQLVQQLNARLFERAWQMLAPADLVANSCLFVMGSEGRGEQLLKTDQDNGL
jgi:CBS domain-containing protein